jgi:Sec-independent protein translocase protein TatA
MQDLGIVLIIILILVLLWRGPKTLPKLGNALGRGVREAREEASQVQADIRARTSDDGDDNADEATNAEATEPTDRPPGTA